MLIASCVLQKKTNMNLVVFFVFSPHSLHFTCLLGMQERIPPREPFLETQEKRVIHAGRKLRVGFTTR